MCCGRIGERSGEVGCSVALRIGRRVLMELTWSCHAEFSVAAELTGVAFNVDDNSLHLGVRRQTLARSKSVSRTNNHGTSSSADDP